MAGEQYEPFFEKSGREHNVDPALLRVVTQQESRFNPNAVSPQGAQGLMQLMPPTARALKVNPRNPEEAIDGAARLLSEALDRNGNVADAVAEYHGGPNRKIWGPKTRRYQEEVLAKYQGGAPDAPSQDSPGHEGMSDDALLSLAGGAPVAKDSAKPVSHGDMSDDDLLKMAGGETKPEAPTMTSYGDMLKGTPGMSTSTSDVGPKKMEFRETAGGVKVPGFLSKEQEPLFSALNKGNGYKPNDPPGSAYNAFFLQTPEAENDVPKGAYYVTRDGEFKRAPGGPERDYVGKLGAGAGRGASDIGLSVANLLPGLEDSTIRNRMVTDQKAYDAELKGDPTASLARFGGQVVGSAPLLAGAEAAAAPALAESAIGRFALGKGVSEAAPAAVRILGKGASLAARGAAEGTGAAALTSSASDRPLGEQLETGAVAGGILGPLVPAVLGAGKSAGKMVKDAAGRWTYQGREKSVDRLLGDVAPAGFNLDTQVHVPGSYPTMAEAAGEPGISALERNARTNPKLAQVFSERMDQNAQARRDFFERVAKDPEAISEAETAREAATGKLRDQAFKGAKPADSDPVIAKIAEILAGPSGQRDAVVSALSGLPAKLKRQTDVQQLYGIRKDIGDMLDPRASSDKKGAQLAAAELMQVKDALDKAIEKAAPGFKRYLKTYSDMSKPIDEMKLLQGMKLTDQRGNITLAKVNSALDKVQTARQAGGVNKAKSVSDETLSALKSLQADLKRADNIMKGKAPGSDTAQNITMQKFAEGGGVPLGVSATLGAKIPGAGLVLGAANKVVAGQNEKMLQQLTSRLLNPENAPPPRVVLKPQRRIPSVGQILLPTAGSISSNNIVGAK